VAVLISLLVGCANTPTQGPIPWWPQGPGNADDLEGVDNVVKASLEKPDAPRQDAKASDAESSTLAASVGGEPTDSPDKLDGYRSVATGAHEAPPYARYGNLYFLSAHSSSSTAPVSSEAGLLSIKRETQLVMEGVKATLSQEALTMTNIVSITLYLTNLGHLNEVNTIISSYFPSALPARTVVEVQRLPGDARLQMTVVAGR
jgi:2-iminobutanoate/2-iminopropanoate deaminase